MRAQYIFYQKVLICFKFIRPNPADPSAQPVIPLEADSKHTSTSVSLTAGVKFCRTRVDVVLLCQHLN